MEQPEILTFSAAAKEFGVDRRTIADLTEIMGIKPIIVGPSKGLTRSDMTHIRSALKRLRKPDPATA